MRALVTGAGGFVGANLVHRLLADGKAVTAVVRPGSDSWRLREVVADVDMEEVDLRDGDAIERAIVTSRPDAIFHLAAKGAYSWQRDFGEMLAVNVTATRAVLRAAREAGVGAVVHAGSSSEYGDKDHPPREDEMLEPASDYAITKAASTHLCGHAASAHDLPVVTLRLYSVYGPWEEPGRLIPALLSAALGGALPPLVDPRTGRDYVFVDDVSDAFVKAVSSAPGHAGRVFNVGTGRQTSLEDVVSEVRQIFDLVVEPEWGTMEAREWDTAVWVSDPAAAESDLDWRSTTALATGLRTTAAWLRECPEAISRYSAVARRPGRS